MTSSKIEQTLVGCLKLLCLKQNEVIAVMTILKTGHQKLNS